MTAKIKQYISAQFDGNSVFELLRKKRSKQVISLYSAMILSIGASIGVSVVNTRFLTVTGYGDFKFIQNLFSFGVAFISLGFFYSGTRLIAQKKHEHEKHEIIGAVVIAGAIMSLVFSLFFFSFSWLQELLFDNNLGFVIRVLAPFLLIYPFEMFCENMLLGDNRIYTLSIFRLGPKITYLGLMLLWIQFFSLSIFSAFGLYIFSMLVFIVVIVWRLKPRFRGIQPQKMLLQAENRRYGFPVFTGGLASLASAQLGGLAISYFVDNANVGFFSLAITATMPLTLIPSTIGNTFFKEFANTRKIPPRIIFATIILSLFALLLFMLFIKELVILLYTKDYLAVVPLAYMTAIGSIMHGFGDFINRFLSAHGLGKELRNSSFAIGITNIIGYTGLVALMHTNGAAITKIAAGSVYLLMMVLFYGKFIKTKPEA